MESNSSAASIESGEALYVSSRMVSRRDSDELVAVLRLPAVAQAGGYAIEVQPGRHPDGRRGKSVVHAVAAQRGCRHPNRAAGRDKRERHPVQAGRDHVLAPDVRLW